MAAMPTARAVLTAFLLVTLAGCASDDADAPDLSASTYKVGKPYQIAGIWYYPEVDYDYDETGIASWYGKKFHGRSTANGETFDQYEESAAHKTLPLPSIVRVRNSRLSVGNTVLVRIVSIIRPPLSPSLQRLTICFTTSSSNVNGILWFLSMRLVILPNCSLAISAITSLPSEV